MITGPREVPVWTRLKAEAEGAPGRHWLKELDDLVASIERDWDVTVGASLDGASESYVATATTADGRDTVVKIAVPGNDLSAEVAVLRAAAGHGYVELLEYDGARAALLLERLGMALLELKLPIEVQLETLFQTIRTCWEVPPPAGLRTTGEKASRLAAFISSNWEELGRPCSERVLETALVFAEARRVDDHRDAVLVHGDGWAGNALQVPGSGEFKFVDPDGLVGDRAYDLAIPIRELSEPAELGREYCALLGRLAGVPSQRIWEWAFVERVSTGLLCLRVGLDHPGREFLETADAWAAA